MLLFHINADKRNVYKRPKIVSGLLGIKYDDAQTVWRWGAMTSAGTSAKKPVVDATNRMARKDEYSGDSCDHLVGTAMSLWEDVAHCVFLVGSN